MTAEAKLNDHTWTRDIGRTGVPHAMIAQTNGAATAQRENALLA